MRFQFILRHFNRDQLQRLVQENGYGQLFQSKFVEQSLDKYKQDYDFGLCDIERIIEEKIRRSLEQKPDLAVVRTGSSFQVRHKQSASDFSY